MFTRRPSLTSRSIAVATLALGGGVFLALGGPLSAQAVFDIPVRSLPFSVAVDPTNNTVFVTNSADSSVSKFDGSAGAPVPVTLAGICNAPQGIAVDPITHRVFVACFGDDTVVSFDGLSVSATPALTVTSVVSHPQYVALDEQTHAVYVSSITSRFVSAFNGLDAAPVSRSIAITGLARGIGVDSGTHEVFLSVNAGIERFTPSETIPTVTLVSTDLVPGAIAVDSGAHVVLATDSSDNMVSYFSTTSSTPTVATVATGASPTGIGIDSVTHNAFVTNLVDGTVRVFDTRNPAGSVFASLGAGSNPKGVAVDPGTHNAFVVDSTTNSVARITTPAVSFAPVLTSGPPPAAVVGSAYSFRFAADANPAPLFQLGGTLPNGLRFDAATATISGTPTSVQSSFIKIVASNGINPDASENYTFVVNSGIATPSPTPVPTGPSPTPTPGTTVGTPTASTGTTSNRNDGGSMGNGGAVDGTSQGTHLASTGLDLLSYWPLAAAAALIVGAGLLTFRSRSRRDHTK